MIFNRTYLGYESPTPTGPDYLCFTSPNAFSVGMTATGTSAARGLSLSYSKDKTTWNSFTPGTTIISANANDKVYMRGYNEYINTDDTSYWSFSIVGADVTASGNIMTLLDSIGESTTISYEYCFYALFSGCAALITAPELPATILTPQYSYSCYSYMFSNCTSLMAAPALPATTLSNNCYDHMFSGCTSLTAAPALPASASKLDSHCYYYMFYGCTSLTVVPKLPATYFYYNCYGNMFSGCTSLHVYSSSGTGHTFAWSIPTSGTGSGSTTQDNMFYGTIGDYGESDEVELNQIFYTQNEPV